MQIKKESSGDKKQELIRKIVANANNDDLINKHLIHGDASWDGPNAEYGVACQERTEKLLRGHNQSVDSGIRDYCQYDSYVVAMTAILREAIKNDRFLEFKKDFLNKFGGTKGF